MKTGFSIGSRVATGSVPRRIVARFLAWFLAWILAWVVVCVGGLVPTSSVLGQSIITQQPGTDYLAFEAEDVWEIVNNNDEFGWNIVDTDSTRTTDFGTAVLPLDTNASRGAAIFDAAGGGDDDFVSYKLRFVELGDYHLYLRFTLFEGGSDITTYGNENSVYASSVFGTGGDLTGDSDASSDVLDADPRGPRDGRPSLYLSIPNGGRSAVNGDFEGRYEWWNAVTDGSDADGQISNPEAIYTPELNTALDFGIAARERHVSIDRIVFHKSDGLTDAELDVLVSFAPNTGLPGDYDGDGTGGTFNDFLRLAENFYETFPIADSFEKGDENRDGIVDIGDFVLFRQIYQERLGAGEPVPEPTGLSGGWLLGTLLILTRKRRM